MSIGKSSIARAVNATATKAQSTTSHSTITKFPTDTIGILAIAEKPYDINSIKQSILKRGVLCPLLVAVTKNGDVWLVDGYRRLFAAKELGIMQIDAVVINVDTKTQANNIYNELNKTKPIVKEDIHEEKFRVLCVKDHDLPTYLL